MTDYPCSFPGCENPASCAVLSEQPREGDPSEWGAWDYLGALACPGHRDNAEEEALAVGKHYRLIAVTVAT